MTAFNKTEFEKYNTEAKDKWGTTDAYKEYKEKTENYYLCTNEILAGLGQRYVADERFKKNIDKHADGTAEFINKAIEFRLLSKEM